MKFSVLTGMLLGLPLIGVILAGLPPAQYLEFPPETLYVSHAPFSWVAFLGYGLFTLAVVVPVFSRMVGTFRQVRAVSSTPYPFPWWGWLGIFTGSIAWILAWTRFPWFAEFQPHTFTPLWVSFILFINALGYRRKGHCMMTGRTKLFFLLFPVSAAFWWFFEYLNRFVQNWHYVGVHFSGGEYFWYATLSFSTVLPAVLGTRDWILGSSWLEDGFGNFFSIEFSRPGVLAWAVMLVSGAGLAGIGVWPDCLFSLLWVCPFLIIISLQTLLGESHLLSDIPCGDWRSVISSSLAALLCGWFWEMWNYFSLAKWEYAIPLVHRYQIFEMPILGYAGYLPFGLECTVIGGMLDPSLCPADNSS
ncbi:MAG: hypothetical protein SV775_03300 [Thermodesulfobacteriota bacterium]|nr:hypothetical protein [Thermodesulfobacteriota bacterium]